MAVSLLFGMCSDHIYLLRSTNQSRHVWQSLSNIKYNSAELEILTTLQSRAISCCDRIWQAVRIILCDDSPEGHLPEELEEVDELDTKDLLSYSFRAIHESRFVASHSPQ